jgi:hypothetical protein
MQIQINGPHQGMNIATGGSALAEAEYAMIMVHGRGASAESIMQLSDKLNKPDAGR